MQATSFERLKGLTSEMDFAESVISRQVKGGTSRFLANFTHLLEAG
jgi:hypothetical protein